MNENDIKRLIETAVTAAYEAGVRGTDEKIQVAINLALPIGIQIGAEVGSKIGAEKGAAAAVRAAERERKRVKKQQYDWKYHNTKLLLRNYRRINSYYQNAVFDVRGAEEADEDFWSIMQSVDDRVTDDNMLVESLQKNYMTTKIIMTHVNKMLDCYKKICTESTKQDDARHWRVLDGLYLAEDGATADEIALREHIDRRTVYRDIDICTEDLTILLFGIGGIENQ